MGIIKIILIGNQNAGKTTLASYITENLTQFGPFNHVAIDNFRTPETDIHQEYEAKLNFVTQATEKKNTVIECSGLGITASILISKLRDLIESTHTHVFVFFVQKPQPNAFDPKHAVIHFKEFNPVLIPPTDLRSRFKIIKRFINNIL